jgi:Co/Zn/Cd efflux system component
VIGLLVSLICAALLRDTHGHSHDHSHGHHHAPPDNNLRAAYLHVMAVALMSVLAIAALMAGRFYGWLWLDPAIGILGALVIAHWSWGLLKASGGVLVDCVPEAPRPNNCDQ